MSTMYDAIERGATKALKRLLNGDIENGGFPAAIAKAVMDEQLLSDKVLAVLADRFRTRLKSDVRSLGARLAYAADHSLPKAMPDAIGEWSEELDRISMAVYYFVEEDDVLEALRFIDMSGSDWSDYIHQTEAEVPDGD